jgi:hypothetical protein
MVYEYLLGTEWSMKNSNVPVHFLRLFNEHNGPELTMVSASSFEALPAWHEFVDQLSQLKQDATCSKTLSVSLYDTIEYGRSNLAHRWASLLDDSAWCDDKLCVMAAVSKDSKELKYVEIHDNLRNDSLRSDFYVQGLRSDSLRSDSLRSDSFLSDSLHSHSSHSDSLRSDKDVLLAAARHDGRALLYCCDNYDLSR